MTVTVTRYGFARAAVHLPLATASNPGHISPVPHDTRCLKVSEVAKEAAESLLLADAAVARVCHFTFVENKSMCF
jgi:hypothetical protein